MTYITTATSSLTILPEEMLLHSFSFLNEKDLAVIICRVNRVYKKMGDQEVLWEALAIKRYPEYVKSPKTREIPGRSSFKSYLSKKKCFRKPAIGPAETTI